ncbi:MAG: tRNA-dihydrouridine synthase family protein [Phycisphaerales bacterium]|nr:tRNA-dihydrouridine synthase family protein [Phycisphaerales bacterium]
MGCQSNNATPPSPAIAPGAEAIDPRAAARAARIDPRIPALIPGFDAPFFQAGLAGYSDAAMRLVARRHGCPCCVTEALLDRTLLSNGRGFDKADLGDLCDNVPGAEDDHPLIGQIMGSDPDTMAAAAVKMIEQGARPPRHYRDLAEGLTPAGDVAPSARTFAAIDVNLACPVKKIAKKARGGHWLREPQGAIDILRAVREALPPHIPTTVKLRRGSDDSPEAERNFMRIFDALYELGYAWATVHGRTVEQKYVGPSRWTFLRELTRSRPDRLIFGSGDVWTAHDVFRMLEYTGVHAVSVARGCIGDPWVFRQARDLMAGREPAPPTLAEQRDVLLEHFALSVAVNGEALASRLMRKFGVRFAEHHPRAELVRPRFIRVESIDDWRAVLDEHYAEHAAAAV